MRRALLLRRIGRQLVAVALTTVLVTATAAEEVWEGAAGSIAVASKHWVTAGGLVGAQTGSSSGLIVLVLVALVFLILLAPPSGPGRWR